MGAARQYFHTDESIGRTICGISGVRLFCPALFLPVPGCAFEAARTSGSHCSCTEGRGSQPYAPAQAGKGIGDRAALFVE